MDAELAAGLTVHVRLVSLALLAVVLAAGTYCRRFGPRGFMGGMLAFMGGVRRLLHPGLRQVRAVRLALAEAARWACVPVTDLVTVPACGNAVD